MKKHLIPVMLLATGVVGAALAGAPKDPVLMTVNGKKVPLSEFMYLYEKNNKQQQQPQSVDEYLDMFVNYKLKVAAAEDAGVDTTAAFHKEFDGYVAEIATPYMRDTEAEAEIANKIRANAGRNVDIWHIMLPPGGNPEETRQILSVLDSLRTEINNGADFGEIALRYSQDPGKVSNKGHMGYITINRWPYPFEEVAFSTPVGQISEPFVDAPYGCHIIKVDAERPDPGQVRVAHILKLSKSRRPGGKANDSIAKAQIDSLYQLVLNGADFAELARANSDDPGSAQNGGELPFFGVGQMVPQFEQTAFALKDGEISEPFKTAYGYHIIKRFEGREGLDTARINSDIENRFTRDNALNTILTMRYNEKNRKRFDAATIPAGLVAVKEVIEKAGKYDSTVTETLIASPIKVAKVGKNFITTAEVAPMMPTQEFAVEPAYNFFEAQVEGAIDNAVTLLAREALMDDNAEYRNLVNEYRDGILLFDISNSKVWERSNKDLEGLETYFRANKDKYTWDVPHYKGYIVMAANDSVAQLAKQFLAENTIIPDSLQKTINERFGRDVRIDRVVGAQGENAIVDYVAFNGPKPDAKSIWSEWFGYAGKIVDAPEDALDMRGPVAADYSQYLESEWVKELRKKYPVKINKKVLKTITGAK